MSRVAKKPVALPKGVEVTIAGQTVKAKGTSGAGEMVLHDNVTISEENGELLLAPKSSSKDAVMMTGTMRALVNNLITGVSTGFERKLELRGVGYRAQAQGKNLNLTLGFSHPVVHEMPEGVTVETPSQTEIVIKGVDKQVLGQVAADIRAYRPPEPYKGKGVRYAGEYVVIKEAKKK
ncbi:MAG: 50S ribosomal protein L6 [Ectothiorhodospiraceae bacterium]|nr:50S ribosomal protein L6 [Ectothiorhodospiraceae bacterium]